MSRRNGLELNRLTRHAPRAARRGSALLVVMGILFVIFIFGFGYANYLSGQVYLLEREKEYEAARMIIRSGFTEALYMLNFDNAQLIQKLKAAPAGVVEKPYEFFEPRTETSQKLMEKVFEKFKNQKLRVVFELAEVMPFRKDLGGERFARFIVKGHFNAGMIYAKLEGEVFARLAKISRSRTQKGDSIDISPERIYAVVNDPRSLSAGKYFGLCVFTGSDPKAAKEAAARAPEFRGTLLMPDGTVITDKAAQSSEYSLTFGPLIMR